MLDDERDALLLPDPKYRVLARMPRHDGEIRVTLGRVADRLQIQRFCHAKFVGDLRPVGPRLVFERGELRQFADAVRAALIAVEGLSSPVQADPTASSATPTEVV